MLARAQRVVLLLWAAAVLTWLAVFLARGQVVLAIVGAAALAAAHALALALEFVCMPWINRHDPAPPATARQRLLAWWSEVRTAAVVFGWRQPFCSNDEPDHLPRRPTGRRGVLLVHGFVCNRGVWNPWMRRLRAEGIPFVAVNLEPVLAPIDVYRRTVEAGVHALEQATGVAPLIVAHSMGGLAVRSWLQDLPDDRRIHGVITVGTPHNGTWMARFGLVHNARDMREGCDWITGLCTRETAQRRAKFTCFYSHCDNIVLPASTATLPGADNRHVAGAAHVQLLYQSVVLNEVLGRLAPSDSWSTPRSDSQPTTNASARCISE